MAREDGQFKKGNQFGRNGRGGRPPKPDWIKGKGVEALQKAYAIMTDEKTRPELQLQAARMIVEYDLGKPQQSVDVVADVGEETMDAMRGMGLKERIEAVQAALEAYESTKKS